MRNQGFVFQIQNECVVASIQNDLDESLFTRLKGQLLSYCTKHKVKGIILDLSAIRTIDKSEFEDIRKIIVTANIMGYKCVVSGMGPGIVAFLVTAEVNLKGVISFRNLDQAMRAFNQQID